VLYNIVRNTLKLVLKLLFKIEVKGKENIPKEIGLIVCSNHYHWLDPIAVACFFNRQVCFMAKKELFRNRIFGYLLRKIYAFPVNRETADISAIKNAIKIVKSNRVLGMFPEGTRVKTGESINAEPGIAMIGVKGKAQIVPIGISGSYKFRSKLLINIGQTISLEQHYGKKISIDEFEEISEYIMTEVRQLIIKDI